MSANIYWGWTGNGWLASIWAGFAALAATWVVGKAIDVHRFGLEAAGFPGWASAGKTAALVVVATCGLIVAVIALGLTMDWLQHYGLIATPVAQP